MERFAVGEKFLAMANRPEGTVFEITESSLLWVFNYANPTEIEIADISQSSAFEIRTLVRDSVLWLFVKCGSQPWAEAPYNPHLSSAVELPPVEGENIGYPLTLLMVDAATCTIRHIRMIGLGDKFSQRLRKDVLELQARPFDARQYHDSVNRAQIVYSTNEMVRLCKNYWRLR